MANKQILHYEVGSLIGVGGMSKVYKGTDVKLGRPVAIKVLKPNLTGTPDLVERFKKEARFQAGLAHPGIVSVHDYHADGNLLCIIMEFVEGMSVSKLIKSSGGPLPLEFCLEVMAQVLAAVDYAHQQGVIHRDMKPSNIIVQDLGGQTLARVVDFGIAKLADAGPGMTAADDILGTVHYMSPEQIESSMSVTKLTDVYSLGVTLYKMVTGKVPFDSQSDARTMAMIDEGKPAPPREINPHIGEDLEKVILRAMARDPEKRYQSCAEFAATLKAVQTKMASESEQVPQVEEPAQEQSSDQEKPGKMKWLAPLLAALAAMAAAVYFLFFFK